MVLQVLLQTIIKWSTINTLQLVTQPVQVWSIMSI